jgi:hypothetical protein
MYQLTCPSCKTPHKTPFVRMGAVAVCGNCSHKYPVKVEYFIKLPPENPASPEMVDRLLGIVPFTPGSTGMAMAASSMTTGNITGSGVIMPNVPPVAPAPAPAPAKSNPPAKSPAPTVANNPPSSVTPPGVRPAAQPAAAAPKPAAPAQAAPAAPPAPAPEAKPQEAEAESGGGFFSKLLKRFK